ncbi:MAG: polyketide synthase dehydratase domain-containing protein [Candidatus Competibacteraceae bacterium]
MDTRVMPYLGDHLVQKQAVLPAAAYVEMALAAGRALQSDGQPVLEEVQLLKALIIPDGDRTLNVQFTVCTEDQSFRLSASDPDADDGEWSVNGVGYLRRRLGSAEPEILDIAALRESLSRVISHETCYRRFADVGLDYGPSFRGVQLIHADAEGHRALGRVKIETAIDWQNYRLHPGLLDSCFQVISGTIPARYQTDRLYLPVRIDRVDAYGQAENDLWVYAQLKSVDARALVCDLRITDPDGRVLMIVDGFACEAMPVRSSADSRRVRDWLYTIEWVLSPLPGQRVAGECGALFDALPQQQDILCQRIRNAAAPQLLEASQASALLERLAQAYIIAALRELGLPFAAGSRWDLLGASAKLAIVERHYRLVNRLLNGLAQSQRCLRMIGQNQWTVVADPGMESTDAVYRTLLKDYPAFFAELSLVSRCGAQLAALLRGEVDPLALLFAYDGGNAAEHFYQDSPSFRFDNTFIARSVAEAARRMTPGQRLRVLEIGAAPAD